MFLVFILLRFLGSVEVSGFKGNDIICDAMREVCLFSFFFSFERIHLCISKSLKTSDPSDTL